MMNQATISIIVPVYNVELYLAECVESLLGQSVVPDEIILVDDGSTDSSGIICDKYEIAYPAIVRVLHQKNKGLLFARRAGFKVARSEYVMSLDSDDLFFNDAISLVKYAICETGADVITFDYTRNSSDASGIQSQIDDRFRKPFSCESREKGLLGFCRAVDGTLNSMCFKAIRRSCVEVDKDYESFAGLSFAEDLLQSFTVYGNAQNFCHLDVPLYYYRPSVTSMTKDYSKCFYRDLCKVLNEGFSYADDWDVEFGRGDFRSGLSGHYLYASARYAEYLGGMGDKKAFYELREAPQLSLAMSNIGAKKLLRFDYRIDLWAIKHGSIALAGLVSCARSVFSKMKGIKG